jgi:glycerol-3-phosphate dehydrogenase
MEDAIVQRPDPATLAEQPFDLAVIGGGINGDAIVRDAAIRGLRALLLEREDFASGTTSWSTRLIHGGLRYLEHGEVGLVRESLRERERLLRNAPHLVQPLPLHIPIYRHAKRAPLTIRAGMLAYDALSFDKSLPRHRMLSREETLHVLPGLQPDGLQGGALYYDAQATFPERLVIEQLLDAAAHGAVMLNHARVDGILRDGFVVNGVGFTDLVTGRAHEVAARAVMNVAGPWVDQVLDLPGGPPDGPPLTGGTKGTHCFLHMPDGVAIPPIYTEAKSDGRAFFVLPWNGFLMIGTTDTRYEGTLDEVVATPDEIAYLLAEARILLPEAGIDPGQLRFTYAGIRPLPSTKGRKEAGITRRHFVVDHAPQRAGLFSIVGGKLTTHRSLAQEAVDRVCAALGLRAKATTANRLFPGALEGPALPEVIPPETMERLRQLFGARAVAVLELAASDPSLAEPLTAGSSAIGAEIVFAWEAEMAGSLADVILRRTMLGFSDDVGLAAARGAAELGVSHLGWSSDRAERELAAYRKAIARFDPRPGDPS